MSEPRCAYIQGTTKTHSSKHLLSGGEDKALVSSFSRAGWRSWEGNRSEGKEFYSRSKKVQADPTALYDKSNKNNSHLQKYRAVAERDLITRLGFRFAVRISLLKVKKSKPIFIITHFTYFFVKYVFKKCWGASSTIRKGARVVNLTVNWPPIWFISSLPLYVHHKYCYSCVILWVSPSLW